MDWQQLASLLIVAVTVAAFYRAKCRSNRQRRGCGSVGGCSSYSHGTPQALVFHARKGERPQVIVKTG